MIICLVIGIFISISSISAVDVDEDIDNATLSSENNNVLKISNDEIKNDGILSLSEDNTTLSASDSDDDILGGTRNDLYNLIRYAYSGDTVELNDDYLFDGYYNNPISINKNNFVIDGKGHTIDGNAISLYLQLMRAIQILLLKI